MTDSQSWAAGHIDTSKPNDSILVRWKDEDGGHREGVLCAVLSDSSSFWSTSDLVFMRAEVQRGSFGRAVIWDRTRNERCIVPLGDVRLVKPRCPKCGGTGVVDAMVCSDRSGLGSLWLRRLTCECQRQQPENFPPPPMPKSVTLG